MIAVEKVVTLIAEVVRYKRLQVDILNTSENIHVNRRISLSELPQHFLDLAPLGGVGFRVALGHSAGALNELQSAMLRPAYDTALANEIQRTYKLHSAVIFAVQLGHHRLDLRTIEHSHKYRLYNIIKVMTERDFTAPKLLRLFVKPAAP